VQFGKQLYSFFAHQHRDRIVYGFLGNLGLMMAIGSDSIFLIAGYQG
jgi:hypothetical protein